MADHPLRSATDRRLGGPLPHQLPNRTRTHPKPIILLPHHHVVSWSYAVLAPVSKCYPPVRDRLLTRYSPVRRWNVSLPSEEFRNTSPLDLHVLSTPPAFVLSQDQTLMFNPLSLQLRLNFGLAKALSLNSSQSDKSLAVRAMRLNCIMRY